MALPLPRAGTTLYPYLYVHLADKGMGKAPTVMIGQSVWAKSDIDPNCTFAFLEIFSMNAAKLGIHGQYNTYSRNNGHNHKLLNKNEQKATELRNRFGQAS